MLLVPIDSQPRRDRKIAIWGLSLLTKGRFFAILKVLQVTSLVRAPPGGVTHRGQDHLFPREKTEVSNIDPDK